MASLDLKPMTEKAFRYTYLKGFYYDKLESLIKVAEALTERTKDMKMRHNVEVLKESLIIAKHEESRVKLVRAGRLYMKTWELEAFELKILELEIIMSRAIRKLSSFILETLEKEGIADRPITLMELRRLPLTLHGEEDYAEDSMEEFD